MPIFRISGPAEGIPLTPRRIFDCESTLGALGLLTAHLPTQRRYAANETHIFPLHTPGYTSQVIVRMHGTDRATITQQAFAITGIGTIGDSAELTPLVYREVSPRVEIGLDIPVATLRCVGREDGIWRLYGAICHSLMPPLGNIPYDPR